MFRSTLCYLHNDNSTLMLLRNKKNNDVNEGKWIGVGGKFEENETAGSCLKREVFEETGLALTSFRFHGIIYFRNDEYPDEEMYLYSAGISDEEAGIIKKHDCSEGTLSFIPDDKILSLDLWEGDRLFLKDLLDGKKRISYDLTYEKGKLVKQEMVDIKNILFDLDGTLIDTGEGIMKSAQYALQTMGIKADDYRELTFFVGPPLMYTYTKRYGVDEKTAREMVRLYRERYGPAGLFESEPYPGLRECLTLLRAQGYKLFVSSSKPEHMCRTLLEHFDLTGYFDDIAGSTPDGRIDTKSEVLYELFRRNEKDASFIGSSVLVGDTKFDVNGANDVGISCVGVSYGYGEKEELLSLGAVTVVNSMPEINSSLFTGII